MAELTVKYTAPLPSGFTSGTLEIKRPAVYIDAAGRKAQAYYRATINADRTLTDVQTGAALKVVAAAQGDPDGGYLDWIETLNVDKLPTPLRQAHRIPAIYTATGLLDLHQPDRTVRLVDAPANSGAGGIQSVLSDGLTVTGDGVTVPLSASGYDGWIGKFWRRLSSQDTDTTLKPDHIAKWSSIDLTNYTIGAVWEGFDAQLNGIIMPKYSEQYTLVYYVDDGCCIYLDDVLIADTWTTTVPTNGSVRRTAALGTLTANKTYGLRIEWHQAKVSNGASANPNRLYVGWSSASQSEEAVSTVGSSLLSEAQAGVLARVVALEHASLTTARLGQPGGIATLGSDGKVPAAQLPVLATGSEVIVAGNGHLLTRTATGQAITADFVDDFSSDRVADRTTTMISGISNSSQTGLTYDSANQRIKMTDSSSAQHFWRYDTRLVPHLQGSMDITLLSDAVGYQHIGLWIPCSADGINGYRICGFGSYLQATYWLSGTEQSGLLFRQPFTWSPGVTHTLAVDIDFVSGASSLSVDGAQFATWVDTHFAAGGIGGFSYGAIASWDNLAITLPAAAVRGLQAGASLWTSAGLAFSDANGSIPLSSLSRVDVCNTDGGVLASAWMRPGDVWSLS